MLIAGALLLASYCWRYKQVPYAHRKDFFLFVQIILFHIYCAYILDLWSLQYITSFKSSFFFNLAPFITALFSYSFFNERMTLKKWLGLAIGFSGFLPELLSDSAAETMLGGIFLLSWPDIAMLGSVTSACYGWIVMRHMVKETGYSPFMVNGIGMFGGGILALITSYLAEGQWIVSPVSNVTGFLLLTGLIIIVVNSIFYNFYSYLLRTYTATFLSFAGFMCPLFVALFGTVFLGEQVTWHFFFFFSGSFVWFISFLSRRVAARVYGYEFIVLLISFFIGVAVY